MKRLHASLVSLCLLGATAWFITQGSGSKRLEAGNPTPSGDSAPRTASLIGTLAASLPKGSVPPSEGTHPVERVLKLKRKILRSEAEAREFQSLLSSPKLLGDAVETLMGRGGDLSTRENETERMKSVDVLTQMVQWQGNPLRVQALEKIRSLLTEPVSKLSSDPKVRHSLSGDRIELFVLLQKQDLRLAKEVLRGVEGQVEERLYRFGTAFYLREVAGTEKPAT
jgi:hypothetical protein